MKQDFETNNFIGKGEHSTFNILKYLTKLQYRSLRDYPRNGIYKQVPISWILSKSEFAELSEPHKKGSIDLFVILNQRRIAVRVQNKDHGFKLRGLGKSRHDMVQENLLKKYCDVVDVKFIECKEVFKEKTNDQAIQEIISSFKTCGVMIPIL